MKSENKPAILTKRYPQLENMEKILTKKHNKMAQINEKIKKNQDALKKAEKSFDVSYNKYIQSAKKIEET